jgi:dGTPase
MVGVHICKNFDTDGATPSDVGAIVASAALAHDIGNPPMGHAGEEAIRHWFTHSEAAKLIRPKLKPDEIQDIDFYEGNAQGFRVLSKLEMPDQVGGMRLTCATLGSFAKYPGPSTFAKRPSGIAGKKFSFFKDDRELFKEVATSCGLLQTDDYAWKRHPLSFLLEAADDITYLIVDFEDGLRLGAIDYKDLEESFLAIIDSKDVLAQLNRLNDPIKKSEFLRAQAIGSLVRKASKVFIDKIDDLMAGSFDTSLIESIDCIDTLTHIRKTSYEKIYNHRKVTEIVAAGFELVSGMLDIFAPCVEELAIEAQGGQVASYRSKRLAAILPREALALKDPLWLDSPYVRLMRVLDYVTGMTDGYALELFQKLRGISI